MNLSPMPLQKFFDNDGRPLVAGRLFTYRAGTTTKVATYTSSVGNTSNTNPITLDFRGEARVWIDPAIAYKFVLSAPGLDDPPTAPIWTVDNITAGPTNTDYFASDSGTTNNIAISIPLIAAPAAFTRVVVRMVATNTGPVVLALNGGTPSPVTLQSLRALTGGELLANGIYEFIYDGARWQLQDLLGIPKTSEEAAAGVTVINNLMAVGAVERYADNLTQGTTDMAPAWNAAISVAKLTGCAVTWRTVCRWNSPVNATGCRGIVFNDLSGCNASSGNTSIIVAHAGIGIDMAGSTNLTFNYLTFKNLPGVVPQAMFFMARTGAAGAGQHRFNFACSASASTFLDEAYQYGSEENIYFGCILYNARVGSSNININATNTAGYASTFVTVATGAKSNAQHQLIACNLFNTGGGSAVNVQLESAADFSWISGQWYCQTGAAYVRVIGSTASNNGTLDSIRGETDGGSSNLNGIIFATTGTTGVNSNNNWKLSRLGINSVNAAIRFEDAAEIQNLTIENVLPSSGVLLDVYNMSQSTLFHSTSIVQGRSGGAVASNYFVGSQSNITLSGTDQNNGGFDTATGTTWETDDGYTSAVTACTGAIIAVAQYQLRKQQKLVTLSLPVLIATATAAPSFQINPPITAPYRPPATRRYPILLQNNALVLNQPGMVEISTAGVITVYREPIGTTNFTAAAGAGIPAGTDVPWNL